MAFQNRLYLHKKDWCKCTKMPNKPYLEILEVSMDDTKIEKVSSKVITLRDTQVIIDRDVAEIYGVTTRDINKAVKNNPAKFPDGYIISLNISEKKELVENFHRFKPLKHSTVMPHAFTEKGLYMLATIIKSKVATEATIAIIEIYTRLRELTRTIQAVNDHVEEPDNVSLQKMMTEVFTDSLPVKMRKTTFSVNTGIIKFSVETIHECEEKE